MARVLNDEIEQRVNDIFESAVSEFIMYHLLCRTEDDIDVRISAIVSMVKADLLLTVMGDTDPESSYYKKP